MKLFKKDKQEFPVIALVLFLTFLWNQLVYSGSRLLAGSWHHYDITTSIDEYVPFAPWTVSIYFGCYIFWVINYYMCAAQEDAERDRFFCADAMAKSVCLICFLLLPTTNFRPEIAGNSIWDTLMRLLYWLDSADNLFPSIHCLVSWMCWVGIRKRKDISIFYRYFSLIVALAVCVSTLTTRQHVLYDVVGGVLLAEICYLVARYKKVNRIYSAIISKLKCKFLKQKV